jgi:hypothetical protein
MSAPVNPTRCSGAGSTEARDDAIELSTCSVDNQVLTNSDHNVVASRAVD